ncbi:MAG: hypothetical protein HY744_12930 [Deltaproteobacteria bacterium]|nr:hypothetical protein [Deltaproteobacteria bacterium]
MRALRTIAVAVAATAAVVPARRAAADAMDPALGRLVLDESCRTAGGPTGTGYYYDPLSEYRRCIVNHAAFAKLVAQYGFALAPTAMHPAHTPGYGGFKVAIEGAFTTIDANAHYWRYGTEGPIDESTKLASVSNKNPDGTLQVYALKLAKGFPFGLELGGAFGYLVNTGIVAGGADLRLALFEGFRASIPGYFPDWAVGGGVRTITGSPELKLTIASADSQLSKPIPLGGTLVLTPHVGYQWIHIFGDSGLVDLTPNTDALSHCGYKGDNTPVQSEPDKSKGGFDGQPLCAGSSGDFNNTVVFEAARIHRHRINFGAELRFQALHVGVHAVTDVIAPKDANAKTESEYDPSDPTGVKTIQLNKLADDPRTEGNDEVKRQWTVAVELGAVF